MEPEQENKEETGLMQIEQMPVVNVDAAVEYWNKYQLLTDKILNDSDYQGKGKNGYKKKSAFRKYATAFNIKCKTIDEDLRYDDEGRIVTAKYIIRATLPNGRYEEGVGVCSIFDKAHEKNKTSEQGNILCEGPCNGRVHFDKPEHDIVATAYTRAKSRAIADVIGTGEVTAEELSKKARKKAPAAKAKPKEKKKNMGVRTFNIPKKEEPIKQDDGSEVLPPEQKKEPKEEPKKEESHVEAEVTPKEPVDDEIDLQVKLQTIEDRILKDDKKLTRMNKLKYADAMLHKEEITIKQFRELKKLIK
jgi:hypothetical protein